MKINKLFFASLAILATLVGCKEKEEAPLAPSLNLDKTEVELGKEGGSATVTLTTNRDWTATPSAEWITVEPESGSASDDAQSVTITVLPNTGNNRPGSVSFSIGLAKKSVSVSQLGEGGSLEDATVYKNDFDKEEATKTYGTSKSSWPFLDQFEGWKNATGTGVGSETYDFSGMSARANSFSNGGYSDYAGSGKNNLFFGSNAYFAIHGIVLPENTNYTLNFGSEKYTQDGSSLFVHSEFHVYISNDGAKWVKLEYAFPNGDKEGRWDLASTTFTVPAGTSSLSIYVGADVASVYRLDDLSLVISSAAGTEIDFSKGTVIGGGSEGDGEGGSLEAGTVYKNDFDKEEATKTYGKSSSSWPYLDQFEGWKNAAGSGVGSETYDFSGMSARANSSSNGSYSDYNGSGKNNLFFGSNAYFAIHGIVLPENTNYTLSFGSEKYTQSGSSLFSHSEFHIYISNDDAKWVELEYAFPNGDKEGRWDLASTTFTVPAGTSSLSIYVGADVASVYRLDDLSLMVSSAAGTEIDFSKGTAIGGGTEGGDEGGDEGGETPGPEDPIIGDSLSVVVKNCTWSAETDPTYGVGFSATISGVKIGYYKYNSTTDLKAPAPDQMRIYKKAALCITAPNGKKVTSVAITTSEKANGNDYNVPLETVVGGGSSVVTSTTSQIWTPSEPAQTIVATSSNGQVRALSFVITLAE